MNYKLIGSAGLAMVLVISGLLSTDVILQQLTFGIAILGMLLSIKLVKENGVERSSSVLFKEEKRPGFLRQVRKVKI